ncbi:MAG: C40 family peptidase [Bacillota bacterium]|nr:C40 family peptidase [Bacillota bacterium]
MKTFRGKVLSAGVFVFALCIGMHFGGKTVKADTVGGTQEGVVIKTATVSTKKVIKIPQKEVVTTESTKTSTKSSSRGLSGGTAIANGSTSDVVQYAFQFLGKPYVYGGTGPKAFDCSGFTSYVYHHFGVELPRTAADQSSVGAAVSKSELRPGDLLFFNTRGYISHAALYIGDGQFIHAANEQSGVTISNLSTGYYEKTYVGARRIMR